MRSTANFIAFFHLQRSHLGLQGPQETSPVNTCSSIASSWHLGPDRPAGTLIHPDTHGHTLGHAAKTNELKSLGATTPKFHFSLVITLFQASSSAPAWDTLIHGGGKSSNRSMDLGPKAAAQSGVSLAKASHVVKPGAKKAKPYDPLSGRSRKY